MNLDEERFAPKQVAWFIAGAKEEAGARRTSNCATHTRTLAGSTEAYEGRSASARARSTSPS